MLQGRQECEERTRKKAEKRKRKKQAGKKGQNENPAKQAKASSSSSDEDNVEEFVYIPVVDQAVSGGDGGAPAAFKNDGSFLDMMKAELEAGSKAELKSTSTSDVQGSGGAVAVK